MQSFAKEHTPTQEQLISQDSDKVFVCGAETNEEGVTIVLTTKNLLNNYYKQAISQDSFLCTDGTYRLNNIRYPSLVVGTVDINRKFHLGKFSYIIN